MSDIDIMRVLAGGPVNNGSAFTFEGPQEGVVRSVEASGVFFTLPAWSPVQVFGPARWHAATTVDVSGGSGDASFDAHHHAVKAPVAGQVCVVVFIGPGVAHPWIVAWADA